jgi:hypothetical protein
MLITRTCTEDICASLVCLIPASSNSTSLLDYPFDAQEQQSPCSLMFIRGTVRLDTRLRSEVLDILAEAALTIIDVGVFFDQLDSAQVLHHLEAELRFTA